MVNDTAVYFKILTFRDVNLIFGLSFLDFYDCLGFGISCLGFISCCILKLLPDKSSNYIFISLVGRRLTPLKLQSQIGFLYQFVL